MFNLINDDCLQAMKNLEDKSIDCVICDPPYGTTACKWDSAIPFEPMWEQLKRVVKPTGAIVLFGTEPFSSLLRVSNLKNFKYDWIWDKITARGHLVAKKRPMQQTETISVFQVGSSHNYYPQMIKRPGDKIEVRVLREHSRTDLVGGTKKELPPKVYDTWYPKNLLKISGVSFSSDEKRHPTQKPVELIEYLVKTYTNEAEAVLDFTMGSGTTGVACANLNRNFAGIEKDKVYFDIAKERIQKAIESNKL